MLQKATFAGGCFWSIQYKFSKYKGVVQSVAGYTGGSTMNPSYSQVCSGATGHAEAVEISFDPKQVSFDELLKYFFTIHDPTALNRQGPDIGTQYRSAIFYHNPEQFSSAKEYMNAINNSKKTFFKPIVTELLPATDFWPAEDEHQGYYCRKGF